MRVNRDFRLEIAPAGGTIAITPPLRIVFEAQKSTRGQLNKLRVQIYNLNEDKRLRLVKDAEENKIIPMALQVGYQESLELVFRGNIYTGSNSREGADIVTNIESLDGQYDVKNAFTNRTVEGSSQAIKAILDSFQLVGEGKIAERPEITRPRVLVGNSAKLIDSVVAENEAWFIDDEKLYIIRDDQVIGSFIPVVSAATGLISTPERENKEVTFETLMNPSLKAAHRCQLISTTAPHLDGVYRIDTITYSGDNYGDDWKQTVTGRLAGNAEQI